jgi:very-short-patch-repair endonuclease
VDEGSDLPDYEFLSSTEFARKLRRARTPAEKAMWEIVHRPEFKEWRFRQQHPVRSYFVDVAAPSIKLAIELDGESHDNRPEYDEARDRALEGEKWRVVRFTNEEVINKPDEVAKRLLNECVGRERCRY